MTFLHILAGLLALACGAVAMYAAKGGRLHRQSGKVFVYAMWVMATLGTILAALKPDRASMVAGTLTFYMVSTALVTVRHPVKERRWLDTTLMSLGLAVGVTAIGLGIAASQHTNGTLDGYPAGLYFFFGTIATIAAALDLRMLFRNGITGKHRLARHLWRMGFALFVASSSFFLGQAKFFPSSLRSPVLLSAPVLVVILFTLYWLVRVLRGRRV